MGLDGTGRQVLYQATKLTRVDVANIARGAAAGQRRPMIDGDCNNFIHVASRNAMDPVAHTANTLKEWSLLGLIMSPVCDGDTRPQSKQQTNKNRATREKSKHDAVKGRQELRVLTHEILLGLSDRDAA